MKQRAYGLRQFGRSIGALLAGFIVVVIVSIGTDVIMYKSGVYPPLSQPMADIFYLLPTAYRAAYFVLGSYITARLAPDRPMQHALIGGLMGLVISTVGAAATWNRGDAFGPHWYSIALFLLAMPTAWAGGSLCIFTNSSRA